MNNKKWRRIEICLIILFFISLIIDCYVIFKEEGIENIFLLPQNEMIFNLAFLGVVALFINIMKFFFIGGIYLCIKFANKKVYKEKLSKIDVKKYDGYFRHILDGYNPAELSYIDDFTLDYPKDYVAMLLSLKNRRIIDFDEQNEKIRILNRNLKLTKSEDLLLNNIVDGKLNRINNYTFSNSVQNDALSKGILQKSMKGINWKKFFIGALIFIILINVSFNLVFAINFEENMVLAISIIIVFMISIFIISGSMFFLPVYGIVYLFKRASHPYVRSDQGEEINKRLEGLKNYLRDFSYMDERSSNELIIWEDYLIYSVLFNQNNKIVNEIQSKYFVN